MSIQASVGILTFNSGATLRRALESVKEFDDIVICDGGSTDNTLAIAQEFRATIIHQDPQYKNPDNTLCNYSGVRNQLLDAAKHDWFLYIDSDETISGGLREEIRKAVTEPTSALVYRVPIGILMDGRYIKHSSNYPGYQTRFFNKRSGARFVKPVHERIEFPTGVSMGTFNNPWHVHTTRVEWGHYLHDNAKYRRLEALRAAKEPIFTFVPGIFWQLRAFAATVLKALWIYVRHGVKDSLPIRGEIARALTPLFLVGLALRYRIFGV